VPTACVTTYEDVPITTVAAESMPVPLAQTIPFPGAVVGEEQRLLFEFYGGVLERLEAAAQERDAAQLEGLLDGYERADLEPWLQNVLSGYRALAAGLRFQAHAARSATLTLAPTSETPDAVVDPPIGAPLCFTLRVPAATVPVHLGGVQDDDPIAFLVSVKIDDTFVDGSARSSRTRDTLWLPEAFTLSGSAVLELPVGVDVPAGESVRRVVHVRMELMPGYVRSDGARVPIQRTAVGAAVLTQWPAGYRATEKAPLTTLRNALAIGDAAHFPHVFLAAHFMAPADREAATRLLIEQLRFGRPDQGRVAMAALAVLTGESWPVGDRHAWLAWWQSRR